jgi:hypothetical protein
MLDASIVAQTFTLPQLCVIVTGSSPAPFWIASAKNQESAKFSNRVMFAGWIVRLQYLSSDP